MKKTTTLKVLLTFFDVESGIKRTKGEEFECSEKRAIELLNYNYKKPYAIPGSIIRIVEISSIIKK